MEGEMPSDLVQNSILKRKRTQRQRPLGVVGNSSSSSEERPSSSSEELMMLEDHQAAKCLMLLAQGQYESNCGNYRMHSNKKLRLERKIHGGGVYECKTCNRTFQSFQALGGHRTSHKKMKITTKELLPQDYVSKQSDDGFHLIPSIALQLETSKREAKERVHECLICGAAFPSGQALGGHMRRHRATLAADSPIKAEPRATAAEAQSNGITPSLLAAAHIETDVNEKETSTSDNEFQCLDLNLPAEDEIGESKYCFSSKQHQQSKQLQDSGIAFSIPALVDYHH